MTRRRLEMALNVAMALALVGLTSVVLLLGILSMLVLRS